VLQPRTARLAHPRPHVTSMKEAAVFAAHVLVAMLATMIVGGLMCVAVNSWLGRVRNPWFDVPYSPLLWGFAFVLGMFVNRLKPNRSAKWVWIVGVSWLIVAGASDVRIYDPRWCNGCSLPQYLWYSYFSYRNCTQECLGQLLGTAPMLNSIAYSLGATFALRLSHRTTSERDATAERF
jgi:hypothetical protein